MAVVNLNDGGGLQGAVQVTVRDSLGRFASRKTYRNLLTDFARATLAQWLCGALVSAGLGATVALPPDRIALGTGTGTVAGTDTALWAEAAGTRKACSVRRLYSGFYAQFVSTWQTSDPLGTYTEAGLFDAAGHLWAHVPLSNVGKANGQILTVQWSILLKNS